jgi:hypothetical protein
VLLKQLKKYISVRRWWCTPIILATQEAEIRRIKVQSQPRQIVCNTLSLLTKKKMADGVPHGVGPEFKPGYLQKEKSTFQFLKMYET